MLHFNTKLISSYGYNFIPCLSEHSNKQDKSTKWVIMCFRIEFGAEMQKFIFGLKAA